jgi:hypothetical protein
MRAVTGTVTPAAPLAMVNMDNFATAVLGVQVHTFGGSTYTLQHSFDDPNDLVSPVDVADMRWQTSLLPPGVAMGNVNASFTIMATPLWFRLMLVSGAMVKATFLQVGEHSHSNITQGPFAPPLMGESAREGSNYAALRK